MHNAKCLEAEAVLLFVPGHKLSLEMWKVLEDDQRWAGLTGDFAPDVFNPDRHVSVWGPDLHQ